MAKYDYKCDSCGEVEEHSHSYKESPNFHCSRCSSSMTRQIVRSFSFSTKNTKIKTALKDGYIRNCEMRQDLRENHMVEEVSPIGGSFRQVYKDIKESGSMVRDRMIEQKQKNEEKTAKKIKEWQIGANKRVERRTIEARKMREKEAASDRKINVNNLKKI